MVHIRFLFLLTADNNSEGGAEGGGGVLVILNIFHDPQETKKKGSYSINQSKEIELAMGHYNHGNAYLSNFQLSI